MKSPFKLNALMARTITKKRLMLMVLLPLMLLSVSGYGQITFSESFDGTTFVPTGWTYQHVSGTTSQNWTRVTSGTTPTQTPHSGAGEAKFNSYSANGGVVAIITPSYDLSGIGVNTATVSFWMYRDNGYSSSADRVEVMINTTASATGATSIGTVNRSRSLSPTVSTDGWYQYSFNIPGGFNGASNYLVFKGTSAYGNHTYIDDLSWTSYPPPCTGTPVPGNTVAAQNPICNTSGSTTLSLQNTISGSGITYQWQSSTNGTTYANISGATSSTYTASPTSNTYYRCNVTCTNSSNTATSTPLLLTTSFTACYCYPSITYGCTDGDYISNMQIGSLNNSSGCSANTQYTDYTGSVSAPSLTLGGTYSTSTTCGYSSDHVAIWFDYNHNGVFESSERTYIGVVPGAFSALTGSVTIPTTAMAGNTVMRVRTVWNSAPTDPCTGGSYGEVEDYLVDLICPSVTITTPPANSTICQGANTSFTVAGTTTTGFTPLTYQWQESTNGGSTWADIANGGVYGGTTTATLNITGATFAMNAYQYRCAVSNSCLTTTNSTGATLTVNPTPAVLTTIPGNACTGGSGSVSVTVNGGGTASWYDLPTGGSLLGTGTTLNIVTATTTKNYYAFPSIPATPSCVATSRTPVQLVVDPPAAVTVDPANSTICQNAGTTFSVTATNVAGYQWQLSTNGGSTWSDITNGGSYSTATTNTLTISNATIGLSSNRYRCKLTTSCSIVSFSGSGLLTVTPTTTVGTDPQNKAVCNGSGTTFSCAATGTGTVSYQWQLSINGGSTWSNLTNTGIYSTTTTAVLNISAVSLGMNNYRYRCITGSSCGTGVASNAAILTINTLPNISAEPTDKITCPGTNTSFSVTASGTGISYQWQVLTTSWSNLTNGGVYSGVTSNTLSLTAVTSGMNGNAYRCVVSGTCNPAVTSANGVLTVAENPAVTTQPSSTTTCTNSVGSLSIVAAGYNNTYQWQLSTNGGSVWNNISNSGLYGGTTTPTVTFTNPTVSMSGYMYRCVVTSGCALVATSNAATLTVATSPTISVHPGNKTLCAGSGTTFTTAASSSAPIAYQWQVSYNGTLWVNVVNNSNYAGATTTTLTVSNVNASLNGGQYRCALNTGCVPATTTNSGLLTVHTPPVLDYSPTNATICQGQSAAFSTNALGSLLTYQWQVSTNGGSTWNNVSNGSQYSGVTTKVLTVNNAPASMNNYRYRCSISGYCTPSIVSSSATLTVNTPVVITGNPTNNVVICSGDNASYTVTATGSGITYRWYKYNGTSFVAMNNGGVYSGVTTNKLTITGITAPTTTVTNIYHCILTGTCSNASTTSLNLTVYARPTITSNPSTVTVCDSTQYVDFGINATGTYITYQWQLNTGSSWVNLTNNATYSNVTTATMRIAKALYAMNGYQYRCVVSGTCTPTATSSAATLNVTPLLLPTAVITGNTDLCTGQSTTLSLTTTNAGSSPGYQWTRNGVAVGTGSTYTYASYNNLDIVQCRLTSSIACPSPPYVWTAQKPIYVTQYVTPEIYISSAVGDSACLGIATTFTVDSIHNGGTNPAYQWRINGGNVGTNSTSFTTTALANGDVVTCQLISSLKCLAPAIGTSNPLQMVVSPTQGSGISISVTPDSAICQHSEVLIYSKFLIGGTNPTIQWMRNNVDIPGETGGKLRISTLNDNDIISCKFFSTAVCVFPDTSNEITFDVTNETVPSVNVAVSYSGNNTYTFTATPINAGPTPTYQWFKNFSAIQNETNVSYTSSELLNSDVIHVEMISSAVCPRPSEVPALSRNVTTAISEVTDIFNYLEVYPNPNSGTFTIKGDYNFSTNADVEIKIVNTLGQNVYQANDKIRGGKLDHKINMNNDVAPGVYIININADGNKDFRRFTINK